MRRPPTTRPNALGKLFMPDILEGSHECKDDLICCILQAACNGWLLRSSYCNYLQIPGQQEFGNRVFTSGAFETFTDISIDAAGNAFGSMWAKPKRGL